MAACPRQAELEARASSAAGGMRDIAGRFGDQDLRGDTLGAGLECRRR